MSRIGKKPIPIPQGVKIDIDGARVSAEGPKGKLSQPVPAGLKASIDNGILVIARENEERHVRALHGLTRSLVANMVEGVTSGFAKTREIQGVGYRAKLSGKAIDLSLGFSHPVSYAAPEGIEFEVPQPTEIIIRGIDKQLVGETAAQIRRKRPPEPYKGKGIRYAGEQVRRKVGKRA